MHCNAVLPLNHRCLTIFE